MDRKKYIVEASDDVKKVIAMGVTHGGAIWTDTMDVENFEELNSDYINEHFGDLQDEAYQRGLNDAWGAARKIVCDDELDWNTLLHIFNRGNFEGIFGDFSPSEAIAKLKAYEEKQETADEIKVGDEMQHVTESGTETGVRCIVFDIKGDYMRGIASDGHTIKCSSQVNRWWKKTGRHFNVEEILDEMKHED